MTAETTYPFNDLPGADPSTWCHVCGMPKSAVDPLVTRGNDLLCHMCAYESVVGDNARLRADLEQAKAATDRALELAVQYGGIDGDHHKAWVIDQMVRALLVTEPVYAQFVKDACDGEDGPDTYAWDTGVIP